MPETHLSVRREIISAFTALGVAITVFALRPAVAPSIGSYIVATIAAGILAVAGGASLVLIYLRGGFRDASISAPRETTEGVERVDLGIETFETRLAHLEARVLSDRIASTGGDAPDRATLVEAIREDLAKQITRDLERRLADATVRDAFLEYIRRVTDTTYVRLREEIESLSRRGNLNLVIGSSATAVAVSLLAYMVLTTDLAGLSFTELLAHYLPRVTTVAFIEVFAFFFLKLYRRGLEDAKFYQNELTGVALKSVAIQSVLIRGDAGTLKTAIEALLTSSGKPGEPSGLTAPEVGLKEAIGILEQLQKVSGGAK